MINSKPCKIEGCNNPVWSKGLCKYHTGFSPLKKGNKKLKKTTPTSQDKEDSLKMQEFLNYLWSKLPKNKHCTSCGKRIYGENLSIYWDHLLEKEFFQEFKYEEKNMFFCCAECHDLKTRGFITPKHKEALERAKKELLK